MSDTTDEIIIRAMAALIEQQDQVIANLERQLDVERKAAKHLIDGIEG